MLDTNYKSQTSKLIQNRYIPEFTISNMLIERCIRATRDRATRDTFGIAMHFISFVTFVTSAALSVPVPYATTSNKVRKLFQTLRRLP